MKKLFALAAIGVFLSSLQGWAEETPSAPHMEHQTTMSVENTVSPAAALTAETEAELQNLATPSDEVDTSVKMSTDASSLEGLTDNLKETLKDSPEDVSKGLSQEEVSKEQQPQPVPVETK